MEANIIVMIVPVVAMLFFWPVLRKREVNFCKSFVEVGFMLKF
jgi:hypothetical protein